MKDWEKHEREMNKLNGFGYFFIKLMTILLSFSVILLFYILYKIIWT